MHHKTVTNHPAKHFYLSHATVVGNEVYIQVIHVTILCSNTPHAVKLLYSRGEAANSNYAQVTGGMPVVKQLPNNNPNPEAQPSLGIVFASSPQSGKSGNQDMHDKCIDEINFMWALKDGTNAHGRVWN